MELDNLAPLNELERLNAGIPRAGDLAQLKQIFQRVEELIQLHSSDFDVQLAATEVKQRLVQRGIELKHLAEAHRDHHLHSRIPETGAPHGVSVPGRPEASKVLKPVSRPPIAPAPHLPPAISVRGPEIPGHFAPVMESAGQGEGGAHGKRSATPAPLAAASDAPDANGSKTRKRALLMVGMLGLAAALMIVVYLQQNRGRTISEAAAVPVPVQMTSEPAGAAISVNGAPQCVANCVAELLPGQYNLTASLPGYEPATTAQRVADGVPGQISFVLQPQPQTIRILADPLGAGAAKAAPGRVTLDGMPAGALPDGQLLLENVPPGSHKVEITQGSAQVSFEVNLATAALPAVTGTVGAKNALAILVATFADQARVAASSGPLKVLWNGQPQGDMAGSAGVALKGFQPGVSELTVGAGAAEHKLKESFPDSPALTVFVKSEANTGLLTINTGQNDVRVFLNGKEYPRRTQGGQLRVPILGAVTVRVQKNLYEEPPAQTVTVNKGSSARLDFKMKLLPEFAAIEIVGGTPGAVVLMDQKQIGSLGADGSFRNNSVPPGSHTIELRRDQFEAKRFTRNFPAGQTQTFSGTDSTLAAVRLAPPPPPPAAPKPEPPPAPAAKPAPAPKPVRTGTIANFDTPAAWREEDGIYRHRGAARLTYGIVPTDGVFTFTIHRLRGGGLFRGGRVRWFVDYVDGQNYGLYEMDDENLWLKVVQDGKTYDRGKVSLKLDKNADGWPVQVDIAQGRVITRIQRDGAWQAVDNWNEPGRNFPSGKFGILVSGNDETGLSNFRFQGR